jgi:hypothetical protein
MATYPYTCKYYNDKTPAINGSALERFVLLESESDPRCTQYGFDCPAGNDTCENTFTLAITSGGGKNNKKSPAKTAAPAWRRTGRTVTMKGKDGCAVTRATYVKPGGGSTTYIKRMVTRGGKRVASYVKAK